ncbi:phosphoribosyltransferase family protein [Cytobacillus sp. FJAT-53684]|uniref:Phosphoribosyltransferase family protein n=1 Tax=Cytobacillus mangrovibacter TaxID=3299024 RepID=A0ABW6JYQ3_9BACI
MIIEYCLVCDAGILPQVSWTTLFSKENTSHLCTECSGKLEMIKGEACRNCDRPLANVEPQYKVEDQCLDCIRWEKDGEWADMLKKNHSLFIYNEFAQEVIARYKYRGDYVLAQAFAPFINRKLHSITFDIIVLIPLSEERLYERGFNQSEALICASGYKPTRLLTRTHAEKQSKKSRSERIHIPQVFHTKESIPNQRILLMDDIYTTGSTLRHAAKILIEAGAQSVCSLTIARG